jgi:YegS/Rv2252/BmrU family lipid kinase
MKIRFILNPFSGRNRRRPWLAPYIREFIGKSHLDASLVVTTHPGHATELARAALVDGCDRVIAVGGDGTMNEVAQALLKSRVALGLVPCGSGNGLALHLGLPTGLDRALQLATAPSAIVVAIDTGSANGHPFFNAMGTGFDAEISERFNRLARRGLPAYARTGLVAFLRRRNQPVAIRAGSRVRTLDTLLIAVANSDQYGNNARIAPGARVDDGELDLVAVSPIGFASAVPLVARLFSGRILGSPKILHLRDQRFVIERAQPGLIHTDGETHHTSAEIQIVACPRSLHLLLPSNTRGFSHRIVHAAHPTKIPLPAPALTRREFSKL